MEKYFAFLKAANDEKPSDFKNVFYSVMKDKLVDNDKKFLSQESEDDLEESSYICKSYRKDTGSCKTGCKALKIKAGNSCPFDGKIETGGEDCPCFQ